MSEEKIAHGVVDYSRFRVVGRQIEGDTNCELFFQPLSH